MMGGGDYLFAYGTLRKNFPLDDISGLKNELFFMGKGFVQASMYDLGSYPGAVKKNESDVIAGDVFFIQNPERILTLLDTYEGSEFKREKESICMQDGTKIDAWIYWYSLEVKEKEKIKQGDYVSYLESKLKPGDARLSGFRQVLVSRIKLCKVRWRPADT